MLIFVSPAHSGAVVRLGRGRVITGTEIPLGEHTVPPTVTVIGIDDTDSRERGMCTTYVADTVARRLEAAGCDVERTLLLRCNPAVEHKTRGNAALAVHTDADAETAVGIATNIVGSAVSAADPTTSVAMSTAVPGSASV